MKFTLESEMQSEFKSFRILMLNNMFSINAHMLEETGAPNRKHFSMFPNPFFIIRNKHLF